MKVLRTPDSRFEGLPDFPFEPRYAEIADPDLGPLRIHYLDEGPADGPPLLCLHGEPTWSYLYRKMIPLFTAAGCRVLAPDLVGFGRSDKPVAREAYTYGRHVAWMDAWLDLVDPGPLTLLGQDWGGLIGLRLVAGKPQRFARISLSNTGLPTGDQAFGEAFMRWRAWSQSDPGFDAGLIVNRFGRGSLSTAEQDAYRAPFPDESYKAGARQFPMLVPVTPDDPAAADQRRAWQALRRWDRPMLLCWSDGDPITAGADAPFHKLVPGTRGQPHCTLRGSHFIQEEDGEAWANAVTGWMSGSSDT